MSNSRKIPFLVSITGPLENTPFCPGFTTAQMFKKALQYEPDDTDLFIASYPKSGTTWMQMIVYLMYNDMKPPKCLDAIVDDNFLEYFAGKERIMEMKKPRFIKTHLPFNLVPYNPKTKYIFVCRNPFDNCVSFYNHHFGLLPYEFDGPIDDFFECFMDGKVEYGDYFEHLKSWYDHKDDPNILFLTYEEMKMDIHNIIRRVAEFIGGEIGDKASNEDVVKKIAELSSFSYMKNIPDNEVRREGSAFMSQGKSGAHTNVLNKSQIKRLYEKYVEYLKGTHLMDLWKPYVEDKLI